MASGTQSQAPHSSPDVPASELHELLSRKLAQCGVMFDFLDCVADLKGKEVKRAALNELVECVGSTRGVLIEPVYPDIIRMVSTGTQPLGEGLGGMGTLLSRPGAPVQRINPRLFCLASWPTLPSPLYPPASLLPGTWPTAPPGPVPPCTFAYTRPRPGVHLSPSSKSLIALIWLRCCLLHEAPLSAQARNLPFAA